MNVPELREGDRCPRCGGLTVIEPNRALRWVCGACGAARVPGVDVRSLAAGEAIARDLVSASQARGAEVGWIVGATVIVLGAALMLMLAGMAWLASHALGAVLGVVAALIGVLALVARGQAAKRGEASRAALDRAWAAAAEAMVRARGGSTTSDELARLLRVPQGDAEAILTTLSVNDRARIDVGDDAELRYRVTGSDASDASDRIDAIDEAREPTARGARLP
jgi:hypothetical protein